jgi:hypothetical protein
MGVGFFVVCAEGRRARRRQLFSEFVALARGAYSLGDDLGESLAESYDIDRRRVHAFSKSKERMRDRVRPDAARYRDSHFCDGSSHAWKRALRGGL